MRAPSLARMAAVAAPRPEADPVTIAHKPSFDIGISSCCFCDEQLRWGLTISRGKVPANRRNSVARNLFFRLMIFMPPPQTALRTALVMAMAFAHHRAQEKTAPEAWTRAPGRPGCQSTPGN